MGSLEIALDRVKSAIRELEEKDVTAKVIYNKDADMIKIYGEGSDYVRRAHSGLSDIQELAYTTAEHHPYWAILYHASEISKAALEKWESQLTPDQVSEMAWRCDEIKMALERISSR
jgi:hypothetical protein